MKLKRLEIYGFKSFAQKTEIAFNQGITGIVGPNGSGKSNIGDAVRWVLGEQSAKALRGSKMEDVIFSGTEKRKAMPYCEVSLVFDNEDGALNSQYTEVMVTRRVYRSGEGEYYLNKTACRLKDIVELFRDTGIGREGYSIIGQGKIDGILSAKGEERRDVFEEAAGIVTYRVRKDEAERSLQKTRDNLLRVNDILAEISDRIEPLREQAEAAKKYIELSNRLKLLEVNIYLVRHEKLGERIGTLRASVEEQQKKIADYEGKLAELGDLRAKLEQEQENLETLLEQARAALEDKNDRYSGLQAEKERRAAAVRAAETEIRHIEDANRESAERIEELDRLFRQGDADSASADEKISEARTALEQENRRLEQLLREAEQAEESLDEHKQRILSAVNRLSDAKSMEARQQTMLTQMAARQKEVADAIETKKGEIVKLRAALESAKNKKADADCRLSVLADDARKIEDALHEQTERFGAMTDEMRALLSKVQGDTSRLALMEEMSKGYEGYYGAVRKAIAYSKNNPRVHGVVARLIDVPKAYETAIDMILGGQLQNIVTEDEQTAKGLIDYLRTNRLGRTTFLPMNAVQPRTLNQRERGALATQGCIGVASELISYDGKYKNVVEHLLGRTVIAKNLDAAIQIMRAGQHAFSVVTLEGDVMRTGGAMTGGTTQNQSISLLGREREMKELAEILAREKARLASLEEEIAGVQSRREEFKRLRQEAFDRMHDEEIAVAREQERLLGARDDLQAGEEELQMTEEAALQLKTAIAEIEKDLAAASEQSRGVTVDREAMEKKTEELQKALQDKRRAADDQRGKVTEMQLGFTDLVHAVEVLGRDKRRWQEEMRNLKERELRNAGKITDLACARDAESKALSDTERALGALCAEKEGAEEALRGMEAGRRDVVKRQRACMDETEQMHQLSNEAAGKLHRSEMILARTEDELQGMTDHIWNAYELTYAAAEEYRFTDKFELPQGEREVVCIKSDIKSMGPINVNAVEEYTSTKERYDSMLIQRDDAAKAESDLMDLIEKLLGKMEKQFVAEFDKMNEYFSETFTRLFGGGKAQLALSDPAQPLTCGIEIVAQPPGKKLQLLSLLSGGERALTAIAILFAMLKLKPTPFCILDEIEAALDEANIGYFADYLAEYARTTQFIVVTHRKGTMERCDALYGVAMQEKGVSGMVSVNMENYN